MLSSTTAQSCGICAPGTFPAFTSGSPAQLVVHMQAHATLILHRIKPSETLDPNMPHSTLFSAIITETHLHLYFPPFVSNEMHIGNDWSDMNLIRG